MSNPAPSHSSRPESSPDELVVSGLACRRGHRLLFEGLSFTLHPGQVLWLRGANGRGKTSLLRLLTGLSTPEAGEIRWSGQGLGAAGAAFREQLLYIGHANGLKDDLTVSEALRFLARIHGRPSAPEVLGEALRRLGLYSRRTAPVRTLSQGQRRRVALARLALDLTEPVGARLWVLDEPYDALDTQGIGVLNDLLGSQARRGGCVVLTSHLPINLVDPEPTVLQLDAPASSAPALAA